MISKNRYLSPKNGINCKGFALSITNKCHWAFGLNQPIYAHRLGKGPKVFYGHKCMVMNLPLPVHYWIYLTIYIPLAELNYWRV